MLHSIKKKPNFNHSYDVTQNKETALWRKQGYASVLASHHKTQQALEDTLHSPLPGRRGWCESVRLLAACHFYATSHPRERRASFPLAIKSRSHRRVPLVWVVVRHAETQAVREEQERRNFERTALCLCCLYCSSCTVL